MPASPLDLLVADVARHEADTARAEHAATNQAALRSVATATPQALVLVLTIATCECGRVHRLPNPNVLVRYDRAGLASSGHFTRRSAQHFLALPREVKTHQVAIPFCEECWGGAG